MSVPTEDLDRFEEARGHLAAVAYRLLGSATEAEDAVQETYLAWSAAERDGIRSPRAWLTRVLTNHCLTQLTSARARRELYVGPWLPEPLLDGDPLLGPAETAQQRDAVSLAVLELLEHLAPRERAVFVLREAFAYPHAEIAEILGTTVAGSHQAYARAKRRLEDRRRRSEVDPETSRAVVQAFLAAAAGGDVDRLVAMLDPAVTTVSDGGGRVPAARRPVVGADAVAHLVIGALRETPARRAHLGGPATLHAGRVNGSPALLVAIGDRLAGIIALDLVDGRILAIRVHGNPDKLARATARWGCTGPAEPLGSAW